MSSIVKKRGKIAAIALIGIVCVTGIILLLSVTLRTKYTVTFVDENNFTTTQKVRQGAGAVFPTDYVPPEGKVFKGWDQSFDSITGDTVIQAVLQNVSDENMFTLDSAYCPEKGEVSIPLKLQGNVSVSSFELVVSYPTDILEFKGFDAVDVDMVTNHDPEKGEIYVTFASGSNAIGSIDICNLVFAVLDDSAVGELSFSKAEAFLTEGDEILEAHVGTVSALIYP
jgi:hypothetical protein